MVSRLGCEGWETEAQSHGGGEGRALGSSGPAGVPVGAYCALWVGRSGPLTSGALGAWHGDGRPFCRPHKVGDLVLGSGTQQ